MNILVLAGGFDQISIIKELKNRGNQIYLVDYYDNPIAKKYADFHFRVSTLDIEGVSKIVLENKIDLVTTAFTDQALVTAAEISFKFGFPFYLDPSLAYKVTNKELMKNIFLNKGIPSSKFTILDFNNEKQVLKFDFKYPIIVKPVDANSSKGVKKVCNEQQLPIAIEEAKTISRSKKVIVEEFVDGTELSIDVFIVNSVSKVLLITKTLKKENSDSFIITGSTTNVSINNETLIKINNVCQSISNSFEIKQGPMLVQLLVKKDDIYIIEFSARTGGGTKYDLIRISTGFDMVYNYCNFILGEKIDYIDIPKNHLNHNIEYLYCNNGQIFVYSKFDFAKEMDLIKEYYIYKEVGSMINNPTSSGDRAAAIIIEWNTSEELYKKRKMLFEMIDIYDNEMRSLLIR